MKTSIVVGGASGIGWASARALAADGYRVVIADVNLEGARNRAAELGAP
ncbi:MAG: SDR family NAD(P)-dependent oxidoreductase, partial [Actinomycetota bacterium]|nr:SDR family NAD(P)-dependent oxidoreductase [Actinomycetota bacterium]